MKNPLRTHPPVTATEARLLIKRDNVGGEPKLSAQCRDSGVRLKHSHGNCTMMNCECRCHEMDGSG